MWHQKKKLLIWLCAVLPIAAVLAGFGYFYSTGSSDLSKNPYVFYDKALTARIGAYAPYAFMDKGGTLDGYVMDLTYAISRVMGVRIVLVSRRMNSPQDIAEQNDADVVLCMVKTPVTVKRYNFTRPYATHSFSVFAKKDTAIPDKQNFHDVLTLADWVVNTDGVFYDLTRAESPSLACALVGTAEEALHRVARGTSRYTIMETDVGNKIIEEQSLDDVALLTETDISVEYSFAVRKDNAEAFQIFSKGLAYLRDSGQLKKIQNKWLERRFLVTQRMVDSLFLYALAVLLVLGACAMVGGLWSYLLKRQVHERTRALEQEARERLKAEKDLSQSRQQLMQADKLAVIGTLASGVAHEINNPNGLLLLNLNFLRDALRDIQPELEAKYRLEGDFTLGTLPWSHLRTSLGQILDDSIHASEHIRSIVNDLRLFSAKNEGEEKSFFSLNAVVNTVLRMADATIKKHTNACETNLSEGLPPVFGNPNKIEQVAINIVLNACQSMQGKAGRLIVATLYNSEEGMVLLRVCDGGRGIPIADIPFLCAPFFTTKRQDGGTGLGLSVSASIVENHKGFLRFYSEPQRGTTVELLLPAVRETPALQTMSEA